MFSIIPSAEYNYIRSGVFCLYGTMGCGVMYDEQTYDVTYQISPIAVRVGNDRIAVFVETGYGLKGILNLGLEIEF